MAGLGTAQTTGDKRQFDGLHAHCDILIIGAGIAGLSAALAAASAGFKIILVDDKPHLGGSLQWNDATIDGLPALDWIGQARAELSTYPNLQILSQSVAFGYYDHNLIGVMEHMASPHPGWGDARLWQIRADQVILATGGFERPLLFADNDRPGVMLAHAAASYATRFAVRPGQRALALVAHDSGYDAAFALHRAGVAVSAIADKRPAPPPDTPCGSLQAASRSRSCSATRSIRGTQKPSEAITLVLVRSRSRSCSARRPWTWSTLPSRP
jgi:sarcosine oxidase subunit alpha